MPDYDETRDWIFSDNYHDWQDAQPATGARPGSAFDTEEFGWATGLYGFKTDLVNSWGGLSHKAASWPNPYPDRDLDGDEW